MTDNFRRAFNRIIAFTCIAPIFIAPSITAAATPSGYTITDDKYEPSITIVSPAAIARSGDGTTYTISLRSFVSKASKTATHQLYIDTTYWAYAWRFYDGAFDDHAQSRSLTRISSDVIQCSGSCNYEEIFGIDMTDLEIQKASSEGFSIKLKSKSGYDGILSIDPSVFAGQLNVLNPYVAHPYAVDLLSLPAADPGLEVWNMGGVNKRLYKGVDHGLNISSVIPGSPADKAGIRKGDMLMDLDAFRLNKSDDYRVALSHFHSGQTVTAKVKHDGAIIEVKLVL